MLRSIRFRLFLGSRHRLCFAVPPEAALYRLQTIRSVHQLLEMQRSSWTGVVLLIVTLTGPRFDTVAYYV